MSYVALLIVHFECAGNSMFMLYLPFCACSLMKVSLSLSHYIYCCVNDVGSG